MNYYILLYLTKEKNSVCWIILIYNCLEILNNFSKNIYSNDFNFNKYDFVYLCYKKLLKIICERN